MCGWYLWYVSILDIHASISKYIYTLIYIFLIHTYRYDIHFQNHICFDIMNIYIYIYIYSLVANMTNYGTSPLLVGKTTINWPSSSVFNSHVSLPEGKSH